MTDNIFDGILGKNFFCTVVVQACENVNLTGSTLQFYQERVKSTLKPVNLSQNNFADKYYTERIRENQQTLITYRILHLSDLAVDLKYVAGAEADCREFRCCHANKFGELKSNPSVEAGPFGSKNCDMPLNGARILLTKLKERLIAEY